MQRVDLERAARGAAPRRVTRRFPRGRWAVALAALAAAVAVLSIVDFASTGSKARAGGQVRDTGSPRCRSTGTSCRTSTTRSWARPSTREDHVPDRGLPPVHDGLEARRSRTRPATRASRGRCCVRTSATDPRPLREHRHRLQPAALDALPRRPLQAGDRTAPTSRVLAPDANVEPGKTWTYRLTAGRDSAGFWPYHDHSPSMDESIAGGLYGGLSILGRPSARPIASSSSSSSRPSTSRRSTATRSSAIRRSSTPASATSSSGT